MPVNTAAIPPRKEPTGQNQLPLSRVKKIISMDQDIAICSNNAAFVITIAAEMFIQHLAAEGQQAAKLDRKPRRIIQYKDIANAVAHQDHLEFLEDVVPKTQPYKMVKHEAAATRAQINGGKASDDRLLPDGKKQKLLVNGEGFMSLGRGSDERSDDANAQLEEEARQAERVDDSVDDVEMTS